MKFRLTKEFSFESAHLLEGYDGVCSEIHGHSYRLFVTVRGVPLTDSQSPKRDMVMDFGDLKRIVHRHVIDRLDHSFVVSRSEANDDMVAAIGGRFERVVRVDYRPTCENMLADFATRIAADLPHGVELYALRIHETAGSYAEWYASDQNDD